MAILRLLSGCLLVLVILAEDTKVDVDKLRKLVMPSAVQTRIVGGHLTTNAKLGGYLIALRYDDEFTCGGALIHDRIVLTAAHCLQGRMRVEHWTAVGGVSTTNEMGERRKVKEVIRPRKYDDYGLHMDVAVMLLKTPMTGKNIGKVRLCSSPLAAGTMLTVAGWGMTNSQQFGPQTLLRVVDVPVIDRKACADTYRPSTEITDSMLCAGILGEKDACTYDSGSPIVYQKKEVCGIVSFGIGCASVRYPGVYTDVIFTKPFILKAMRKLLKTDDVQERTRI